ncbi:MAG: dipeptidase PepV [Firmicutes bacterium]|nr:dipeptidase PepV [Bacillota bacterium]
MQKDYLNLIDEYRDELVQTLSDFIKVKSVEGAPLDHPEKGYLPFGEDVHNAFEFMVNLAHKEGFTTFNADNYGGHIDFDGDGSSDEIMGIVGHLDVVPEGEGWTYPPYSGTVADGKIWGRGTGDDKGPVIAAFYAMKALKDSGFIPKKKIRMILGLDEETNWIGIEKYFEKAEKPTFGFTPDAMFPAIHGEKGTLGFKLAKKFAAGKEKGLELRSVTGGTASNAVADRARAIVRDENAASYDKIKELAAEYRKETGYKVNTKGIGKTLEITVEGVAAHAAFLWDGLNAISIMMDFLGRLDFANDDVSDFISFYNKYIGFHLYGEAIGCGLEDEVSGKLTFNVGLIELDSESVTLTIDTRYPVTLEADMVYDGITPVLDANGIGLMKGSPMLPIYMPADGELISTLMDVYKEHTGDVDSKPLVIGGATYARACEGIVAFGASFPGDPDLAHQKDEYIEIDKLVLTTKIFADAIYRLTK